MKTPQALESRKQNPAARTQATSQLAAHTGPAHSLQQSAVFSLQGLADQSAPVQRLRALAAAPLQRVATANPIQFELIKNTPENRKENAKLVRWYHAAEDDAKATLRDNPRPWSVQVLEEAIDYYYEAADYREQSGDLHKVQDEGHLKAIDFCYNQANYLSGILARRR
ncbi:MAG: hypothetical protein AB8B58_08360 [Roseobacter sp.]